MLQNALNDSPDIFLLGEPDIYGDDEPGFAARYNAMHRSWGNQEAKSSYLPAVTACDGGWRDHLAALAKHHRWVGAKLVTNPVRAEGELARRFDFHTQHFYASRYIFPFRDPLLTAISTRDLQLLTQGETDGLTIILRNIVEMIGFYIRAVRLLPHVKAVFHEQVDQVLIHDLDVWLGASLPNALSYYDTARVRDYSASLCEGVSEDVLQAVRKLYQDLREAVSAGLVTPQLEQNDHHLSPDHYTALGSLDRRARVLVAALA